MENKFSNLGEYRTFASFDANLAKPNRAKRPATMKEMVAYMIQEFSQEVKNTITELLQNVHTAIPGKIIKYYPDKCEAEILPYGKFKKPNGEYLDFPQLNHVPILFPQSCGQNFTIVFPVNPGDECLIITQEQTLDIWRNSGAESENDLRHDLTRQNKRISVLTA